MSDKCCYWKRRFDNIDGKLVGIVILIGFCIIGQILLWIDFYVTARQVDYMYKQNTIQQTGLIEVNGELVDEDDYNQMDWRSYTPTNDSVK